MRIAFVSSEVSPYAKAGGLGDATAALAHELHRRGHDVRIYMPLYSLIDRQAAGIQPVESLQDIGVSTGRFGIHFDVQAAPLPRSGPTVYFIDCPMLYDRPGLYTNDGDEHLRFSLLSRAAIECFQRMAWAPEIVQCNDWQTALIPLYLRSLYGWDALFANTTTVMGIHNLGYQGVFGAEALGSTGLGAHAGSLHQEDLYAGQINFLKTGLLYADMIITVSPTYAKEICTPEYGMGLDGLLRTRSDALRGVLNGVDYQVWSPETDQFIARRYSVDTLEGKVDNKQALAARAGLDYSPDTPIVGIVSRLVKQKGFELAFEVLPRMLFEGRMQLAVLGSGEFEYEEFFAWLAHEFTGRAAYARTFDEPLAHLIEAGSDLFLMPSLYEPCGLNQMYSLRYGTIPIVRKTGGLADTVRQYDASDGTGNGIVFEHYDSQALSWALDTALRIYQRPVDWRQVMLNAMREDFSWQRLAVEYEDLYRVLAAT